MQRQCPVPHCDKTIGSAQLLCFDHWVRVPTEIELRIFRCLARVRRTRNPMLKMRATTKLKEARRDAIQAVIDQETSRTTAS